MQRIASPIGRELHRLVQLNGWNLDVVVAYDEQHEPLPALDADGVQRVDEDGHRMFLCEYTVWKLGRASIIVRAAKLAEVMPEIAKRTAEADHRARRAANVQLELIPTRG